jgi:hypothetical protein
VERGGPNRAMSLARAQRHRGGSRLIAGQERYLYLVRFEVFTAVTMKNAVIWDVTPCGSLRIDVLQLIVTANVVPSSQILFTRDGGYTSETSVLTRATRWNIPEDDILHSHRRENLKSYTALAGWTL